jgi:putative membrane protein
MRRLFMMWWGNWGWGMGLMMFLGLIFWGSIIWLVVWAVSRTRHEPQAGGRHDALDIARARYAKGEITKEQFDQIKKDLIS